MSEITIKQVESRKELKQFVRFNYELYKDNPYSVPDIYEDMMDTFSDKNPAMEYHQQACKRTLGTTSGEVWLY